MKIPLLILSLLCFEFLHSQQNQCVPFEILNVQHVAQPLISEKEVAELDLSFGSLQLIVLPETQLKTPRELNRVQRDSINGIRILLVNTTSEDIDIYNMDRSIIIERQAYYKGKWVKVDRIKNPLFCGNSFFYSKMIKPKEIINFLASCTEGDIKTQFRFVVYLRKNYKKDRPVYSNTFYGYLDSKYVL